MKLLIERIPVTAAESRPTRGAWIETYELKVEDNRVQVAPHTGRVD